MSVLRWLRSLSRALSRSMPRPIGRPALHLEALEDRTVLSWTGSLVGTSVSFSARATGDSLILGVNNQGLITQNISGGGYAAPTDLDPNTPGVQSLGVSTMTQLSVLSNPGVNGVSLDMTGLRYTGNANLNVSSLKVQ